VSVPSHKCLEILSTVADAFNSPVDTKELLERTARAVVEQLDLKACQFSLLSQDQQLLDHIASSGLGEAFLDRGPVETAGLAEALEGKPVTIGDCRADPRVQYPEAHSREGLVSSLAVPLKTRGQVIGVVQAYAGESRGFSETDVKLMEVLAAFCARAVTHSMFHKILDGVTAAIRSSLSLEQALESVARAISEDLRLVGCTIHLLHGEDEKLKLRAAFGPSKKFLAYLGRDPGTGFAEALQGRCTQLLDAHGAPETPFLKKVIDEGVSSILYVPLMIRSKAVGVLCLYTHRPYEFSEDERYFMKAVADECGLAIQQSRIHSMFRQSYETLVNDFQIWFESGYRQL
jgi:signal transduction protein with GAF and PtsI domain